MIGYNEILEMGTPRSPTSVSAKSMPLQEAETLRDRFAMAALTGLLSVGPAHHTMSRADWAAAAYKYADAMMEARK